MVIQPTSKGLFPDDFSLPSHRLTLKLGWIGSLGPSRPVLENNGVIFIWLSALLIVVSCVYSLWVYHDVQPILHFLVLCQNLCVLSLKDIFVLFVFSPTPFLKADAYMEIAKMLVESSKTAKRWGAFAQPDSYCVRQGNYWSLEGSRSCWFPKTTELFLSR